MKRSKHSLSNYKLLSCDMGELIPCGMYEVLPGDTVQQATTALVRLAPMVSPVMHPVETRIHHFYVPYRVLWEDFEDFITGGPDGMDASVYPTRAVGPSGYAVGELADYLGIPTLVGDIVTSALPFRAYAMIYNEYFRDQDLVPEINIDVGSGNDTNVYELQNIAWGKDYFTDARPWEQKGPAITIPLGDTAPVERVANADAWQAFRTGTETIVTGSDDLKIASADDKLAVNTGGFDISLDPIGGLQADLSGASAVTVNILREALALQRYEEARARFGSRYTEYLRYLGVKSSDARLQRPEYLGGGRQTLQFSEVLSTAEAGGSVVGSLAGHGISAMKSNRFRRFFEEHGIVLSLMSTRPKGMYQQGLDRMWNRRIKEDFWQKELEHIGQQEILNKEIYAAHTSPDGVFGYQDRYDEYRKANSTIAGEFRTTLNHWHLAREFSSDPALNEDFVKCVPTQRIFAATTNDVLQVMAKHSIQARRLVTKTGTSFIF